MELNKTAAKQVQQICRMMPRNAFKRIEERNITARRNHQWAAVEAKFRQNCNMATRAVLTPNPDPALLRSFDPQWSQNMLNRVKDELVAVGGKKTRKRRGRGKKTRRVKRV